MKHDPAKADTNRQMCEAIEANGKLIGPVRRHGAVRVYKGAQGVLTVSDRPTQLDHHGRRRLLKLAKAAGILLVLIFIGVQLTPYL